MDQRHVLGKRGEEIAQLILEAHGYVVIERNLRTRFGEIDFLAQHGDKLVAVEVKARSSGGLEDGFPVSFGQVKRLERSLLCLWSGFPKVNTLRIDGLLLRLDRGKLVDCRLYTNIGAR